MSNSDISTRQKPSRQIDSHTENNRADTINRGLFILIALVVVAYLIQVVSPLRINTDAIRLLYMSLGWQEGVGLYGYGEKSFPPGYPLLLASLEQLGLRGSWIFITINLISLFIVVGVTLSASKRVDGLTMRRCLLTILLTLCAWPIIKHITIPLTDTVYMAVSFVVLYLLWGVEQEAERSGSIRRRRIILVVAAALMGMGIMTRTHGIAMIPALFAAAFGTPGDCRDAFAKLPDKMRTVTIVGGLIVAAVVAVFVMQTSYANAMISRLMHDVTPLELFYSKATDFGQVFANLPITKIPQFAAPLLAIIGSLGILFVVFTVVRRFWSWTSTDFYLAGYLFIFLLWPYGDPRFIYPVLPLIWLAILRGLGPVERHTAFVIAIAGWFVLTGSIAMAYSTRITLTKDRFPDLYSPYQIDNYRAAYGQPPRPNAQLIDPKAVRLIRHYQFGDNTPPRTSLPSQHPPQSTPPPPAPR